jgi:DNA-binding CsgD family transcriptional regulator
MLARDLRGASERPRALTARQRQVLELVASGRSNKEIASRLRVSENGVKAHIARLLAKFDVPNRAALVRTALPAEPEAGASARQLYLLLQESLGEVIGRTATEALLRRAVRRASTEYPELDVLTRTNTAGETRSESWTQGPRGMKRLGAVMRQLWPLLMEITGPVVIARLERRGIVADDRPREGGTT